ncbi:hypothetical protein tb265_36210 [Gemmatimonadetes bacterium T265]|nr:hypothetical protein tb265_36210 [Gemmatimonadetes bacterium T265]
MTVFNGARDGYQVPLALAEAGRLEALVTDWYSPLDRRGFARALAFAPERVRSALARRRHADLPSRLVRTMPWQAVRQRVRPDTLSDVDARLGGAAGELARARGAGLLAYSYYAHAAFAALGTAAGARVLFQVQAHPAALRRVFVDEASPDDYDAGSGADGAPRPLAEWPRRVGLADEPFMADRCVAPSTYVRTTLVDAGVAPDRVSVVPYGVDLDTFNPSAPSTVRRPFRVVYAGQLLRRKGLQYLLAAWKRLALPNAELLLVGRGASDGPLLRAYAGLYRVVRDVHARAAMARIYAESDVCCLPSLSDAFGHVLLEALACGTPVIGTVNTAAPDLVTPGENGFVVPIRDVDALLRTLTWCYENPDALAHMRAAARRRAEQCSWGAFRRALVACVD